MTHSFRPLEDEELPPQEANSQTDPYIHTTATTKTLHFSFAAIQSRMDTRHPENLALEYTRVMMGFVLLGARPRSVAMIGLGGGSMVRFILKHLPGTFLKVVEINPAVLDLREEFQIPADGDRFRVRLGNGADFVRRPPRSFDVLLVDGFDVSGQPTELATAPFYMDCAQVVGPSGIAVINLSPAYDGYERQIDALHNAFDGHVALVPDRDSSNTIAFASQTSLADLWARHGWTCRQWLDRSACRQLAPELQKVAQALQESQ